MASLVPNRLSSAIEESATLAITARAAQLRGEGRDVISLSAGEPDFPTPDLVAEAGIEAIRAGDTRYTAAAGKPALRQAGAEWFRDQFGLDYRADEVMVTAGAKPALHIALMSIVEPGDTVLALAPYWVSYPALVRVAGGVAIQVPPVPESGFVHDPETIDHAAETCGAKGLLLNFPNNPSGAVPTRAQMEAIVEVAERRGLWILSDEIYARLLYDGVEHISPASIPGARERTMVVNGGTKKHSMTGWRVGFLAGPAPIIDAAARLQSQVIGNASSISQAAGLIACTEPLEDELQRRVGLFDERRRYLVEEINRIPGLQLEPPQGAFYALVDARGLCSRVGLDDVALCKQLLEEQLLALVPGTAFAIPGFLRVSYASAMDELAQAVKRLRAFAEAAS